MKSIFNHIRDNLHKRLNIQESNEYVSIEELRSTEWSHEFERLQRSRLLIGALRYGRLGKEDKPRYNRCSDIKRRIDLYINSGNLEYLVDAANLCMCEFVEGEHPNKHFEAKDDETHTKIKE